MQPITIPQLIDMLPPEAKKVVENSGRKFSTISDNSQKLTCFVNGLYNNSKVDAAPILGCFGNDQIQTPYTLHLKVYRPTILLKISKLFVNITKLTISIKQPNLDFIFRQFPNLKNLDLVGPGIPNALPKNIETLLLNGSEISIHALDALLCRYQSIRVLTLASCDKLTSDSQLSPRDHRNIESLRLINCKISQVTFEHLIEKCTLIKELQVELCPEITSFQPVQIDFRFLHNLIVAEIPIEESKLKKSIESLTALRSICIESCKKISSSFFSSCSFGAKIKTVDLHDVEIDRNGLENLFKKAPALTALRLSSCRNLLKEDFVEVSFPQTLTEICLEEVAIDLEGVNRIHSYLHKLENISYNCPDLPLSLQIESLSLDDAEARTPSPQPEPELQFALELD